MVEYGKMRSVKGPELETAYWGVEGEVKGVVQLVHGMTEYIRRYDDVATALNKAGYVVVGHTHLGHNFDSKPMGYFAHEGGWDALVEDVHQLRKKTQAKFPKAPYFLLGHSMGSFIVRTYALQYAEGLSGLILCGTGFYPKALVGFGIALAKLQCALGMEKKPGKLIKSFSFSGYNKRYAEVKTPCDWLNRDSELVMKYVRDPYSGYTFTVGAYRDMFDGLSRITSDKLATLRPEIPAYFVAGDMDPVGSYGEGVRKVADEWKRSGVKDVTVKLYPDGRHEILNELNKEEVRRDLVAWMDAHR